MAEGLGPPLELAAVPPGNRLYLLACGASSDPSMVWGTEVDMGAVLEEAARRNRDGTFLLTPVHFLVKAVERAVAEHPEINRRILGGRVHAYEGRHLVLSTQRRDGSAGVVRLDDVQEMGVEAVGRAIWSQLLAERTAGGLGDRVLTRRRYPLYGLLGPRVAGVLFRRALAWVDRRGRGIGRLGLGPGAPVLVNYLGGRGMPPMRSFVPSRLPVGHALTSVTIGPSELRPVVRGQEIETRWMAPLHVRSDHRLVDGIQLGRFTGTLKAWIEQPERL